MGLDHALLCVACFVINMPCDMCDDLCEHLHGRLYMEH